jgi:uncharacterized protein YkwD
MRGGVAILIALLTLAAAMSVASSHAASTTTLRGKVANRMKTLSRSAVPARKAAPQTTNSVRSTASALETAVLSRINRVRRGRGLRALRWNKRLAAAADFHSRDMGKKGYFEHESANGTAFWRRIERFYPSRGFSSWTVGENLLWASDTYGSAFAVHEWMTSPPHRENILSRDWRELGIGAATFHTAPGVYGGRTVTIVTADFGARTG